ncbi:hypothetical protein AGLY_015356 [Aphis glycines]|uniref:Uncharacterized protein n=1 Tax=Aphis glycines TaxID=307491 RepID=A0A6G0T336_APHGL|nr:hypothetical protein AGLY_015356 [Aphis glycines]
MNTNLTGTSPKNPIIPKRSHTSISNTTNSTPKTKINKPSHKTASIQRPTKNIAVQGTDRFIGVPSTTTNNHISRIAIKDSPPTPTLTTLSSDNNRTADNIADNIISTNDQPITSSSIKPNNNNINFATAVSTEKIPATNKPYEQILDNLLQKTQSININDQIIPTRRLVNPAKKYIISNVCPSIPNLVITNALNNLNIFPISQINHLKAGINIEGFEHIMSFRRQLFIKHEDIPKLPNSPNKSSQHDDLIVDHTEPIENIHPPISPTLDISYQTKSDWAEILEETKLFPVTQNNLDETLSRAPIETQKRPMSDSSSSKPPDSPNALMSSNTATRNKKITKKPKIHSHSNSSSSLDTNLDEKLNPIIEHFTIN